MQRNTVTWYDIAIMLYITLQCNMNQKSMIKYIAIRLPVYRTHTHKQRLWSHFLWLNDCLPQGKQGMQLLCMRISAWMWIHAAVWGEPETSSCDGSTDVMPPTAPANFRFSAVCHYKSIFASALTFLTNHFLNFIVSRFFFWYSHIK